MGRHAQGDGDSQCSPTRRTGSASPVEAIEFDVPVVVLRREIVPDTAGPG